MINLLDHITLTQARVLCAVCSLLLVLCGWYLRGLLRRVRSVVSAGGRVVMSQSITGDGNVQSHGDAYREPASDGASHMSGTFNGMRVTVTSDQSIKMSSTGDGFTLTMGATTVEVER